MYKIAHRGASGYEQENSIASLNKAISLGADIIEADVQITKDEVPIIFHDRLLDRNTNTSGYVSDFTLKEFEENIRLNNGEKVPTLKDFCTHFKNGPQKLYLDLKTLGDEVRILKTCKSVLSTDQFLIGSFHNHSIKLIKQMDAKVKTGIIMEGNPIDIIKVIENANCDFVAMGFDSIEDDTISIAQELGKEVFVWVVNDPREVSRAKSLKVNGITSDFPDRL